MTDIVDRLRRYAPHMIHHEAADEIECERKAHMATCMGLHEAQEEIERLRAAQDAAICTCPLHGTETHNQALEEAAKVADAELDTAWRACQPVAMAIAAAIRALKDERE